MTQLYEQGAIKSALESIQLVGGVGCMRDYLKILSGSISAGADSIGLKILPLIFCTQYFYNEIFMG
jgi:hypothetical protein